MKRLLLSTLLGGLTLAAAAQTQPDSEVRIRGYQIELPVKAHHMFSGDFDIYKGAYDLSNGETMVLRSRGSKMYADIGDRPRTEMVAASANEFVAVDRQFKMTLAQEDRSGLVTGELLLVMPSNTGQAGAAGGEVVRLLTSR